MINVIDEVLAGSPRYNIKENGGSTLYSNVQIDLSTNVNTVGTPLNKALFDSIKSHIDLVGKYNTPTIVSSATQSSGSYIPVYTSATDPTGFQVSGTTTYGQPYYVLRSTPSNWQGTMWQIMLDARISAKQFTITFVHSGSGTASYTTLFGSNDGETWDKLQTLSFGSAPSQTTKTMDLTNTNSYKYYQLRATNSEGEDVTSSMSLFSVKITKWYALTSYNSYSLSNIITSYEKGQRALLFVPSSYVGGGIRININALGNKNITPQATFQFAPNQALALYYDGTNFVPDIK